MCPSPPTRSEEAKDILSIALPIEETFQLDCLTLLANVRGVGARGGGGGGLQPPLQLKDNSGPAIFPGH